MEVFIELVNGMRKDDMDVTNFPTTTTITTTTG